jgi:hypothetical protein
MVDLVILDTLFSVTQLCQTSREGQLGMASVTTYPLLNQHLVCKRWRIEEHLSFLRRMEVCTGESRPGLILQPF